MNHKLIMKVKNQLLDIQFCHNHNDFQKNFFILLNQNKKMAFQAECINLDTQSIHLDHN